MLLLLRLKSTLISVRNQCLFLDSYATAFFLLYFRHLAVSQGLSLVPFILIQLSYSLGTESLEGDYAYLKSTMNLLQVFLQLIFQIILVQIQDHMSF